jgi:hypothetical protein
VENLDLLIANRIATIAIRNGMVFKSAELISADIDLLLIS